ncbi:carboxymuconolactone decarboxylase family protein [Methylocystis heyeri]|uniref:Carboxymuconolactone decarboxylase family protein n=1 Tax=Methylocystis heyeri TaxID=391905 RepID=A0A6B8KF42_9HYPH|nr:carboxymuconolactone decarboxylase family protein [Methylocystis heyeri]QGM46249.1 carboxymuconolactone decarboxylase family protein [Methylocystis heyeri]
MERRMNIAEAAPALYGVVRDLDLAVRKSGLDPQLLHLLKLRASQINHCAYCVDLHVRESLADGVAPQKLHLLAVWRESPLFDERERAVLEWTESVTLAAETGIPDEAWKKVRAVLSEAEIGRLTVAIGMINLWNRIAVGSRMSHPVDAAQ